MTGGDPLAVAQAVATAFEQAGIRYILGGSLASTAHGEPRTTLDVDFAADLDPAGFERWAPRIEPEFLVDSEWALDEIRRRGSFQMLHRTAIVRVDVFVPEWTGMHLWKWQHRRRMTLHATAPGIDVTSAEGIVVQKLLWYRDGGGVSERQWRDVLGVLKAQRTGLDRSAVRSQSERLGLVELFERAEREAGAGGA
ncbi:MAG: hypothetical protein AB7O97_09035 [Planctomycetota bacterium]